MGASYPTAEFVEWVDSTGPHGWKQRSELVGYSPDNIVSVGFVLDDADQHLTLAPHWASECVDGVVCIPKSAITRRTVIALPKTHNPKKR